MKDYLICDHASRCFPKSKTCRFKEPFNYAEAIENGFSTRFSVIVAGYDKGGIMCEGHSQFYNPKAMDYDCYLVLCYSQTGQREFLF